MAGFWVGGEHPTSGLAGYPARDYGAPAGTPVYAWEPLRVTRISGASGSRGTGIGGYNVYLQDRAGKSFFLTHVENLRIKTGQVLQPGQQLASVGAYSGMAQHVHIGYTGGDPSSVLGLRAEYIFTPGGSVQGSKVVEENTLRGVKKLTPEQLRNLGRGILSGSVKPQDLPPGSTVQGTGGTIPGTNVTLRDTAEAIKSPWEALRWIGGNWDRVAEVVAGFILVLVGLILLGRSMGIGGRRIGGDLANRLQFGPKVEQAQRENLSRPQVVYEVSSEPKRPSSGYNPETSEIPF